MQANAMSLVRRLYGMMHSAVALHCHVLANAHNMSCFAQMSAFQQQLELVNAALRCMRNVVQARVEQELVLGAGPKSTH
jgi:hypothetical protein